MRIRFPLIFLCSFCLVALLQGQAVYNGHVQDVVTQQKISGVQVQLLNSSEETVSNSFGDFLIKNTAQDSILPLAQSFRFFKNSLIWSGEFNLGLEIFSIDGKRILHQPQLGKAGSFIFPNLPFGIYVLRVKTENGSQTFKAFSDGEQTSIADADATWHRSSVVPQNDTLLFSKEGYFERQIPLTGRDTFLRVNLLKKENDELNYFNELIDPIAFELVSSLPSRSNDGGVTSVKIIYNTRDELMYYMNTKRHPLHHPFAEEFLDFNQGNNVFNQTQYRENENRYLYPANLNYYKDLDKYVLHFVSANEMSCENIKILMDKILATSYLGDKLFLLANRPEFNLCDVSIITPEELYEGRNYQALNLAENFGYLTKVRLTDLENTYLGRRDIVLLDGIPNDVSVVAGIITTEFQTPLSHINVLSHNRNTPNMALRDG